MKMKKSEKTSNYLYSEFFALSRPKINKNACGDYFDCRHDEEGVTAIVTDGLGSGIKASIASRFACSHIMTLLSRGFSLRATVKLTANMMHRAKNTNVSNYAAFSIARILSNGGTTIITYEAPPPIIISNGVPTVAEQRFYTIEGEIIGESRFSLKFGDSVMLMSDGVSQAGMGHGYAKGWGSEGIAEFVGQKLSAGLSYSQILNLLIDRTTGISGGSLGDDTTAIFLSCRAGRVMYLMTGPPYDKGSDEKIVKQFISQEGIKVICGSTTADIISKITGKVVERQKVSPAFFRPPKYYMQGLDLVTEGAIVLNQLYNIVSLLDIDLDMESCVSELAILMRVCDIIHFYVGGAENVGHNDIAFAQMGIIPRKKIVDMLSKKLREMGKLVIVHEV